MNTTDAKDWDILLVKGSAMTILTIALISLPSALGSMFQIFYNLFFRTTYGDSIVANAMRPFPLQTLGIAVGQIAAFIILLLLAAWMFAYPPIIRKALQKTSSSTDQSILP